MVPQQSALQLASVSVAGSQVPSPQEPLEVLLQAVPRQVFKVVNRLWAALDELSTQVCWQAESLGSQASKQSKAPKQPALFTQEFHCPGQPLSTQGLSLVVSGLTPQSAAQLVSSSDVQTPSPQLPPELPQSAGQEAAVSLAAQTPSPQLLPLLPQSAGQLDLVSPLSQVPLPHVGPVEPPVQPAASEHWISAVSIVLAVPVAPLKQVNAQLLLPGAQAK